MFNKIDCSDKSELQIKLGNNKITVKLGDINKSTLGDKSTIYLKASKIQTLYYINNGSNLIVLADEISANGRNFSSLIREYKTGDLATYKEYLIQNQVLDTPILKGAYLYLPGYAFLQKIDLDKLTPVWTYKEKNLGDTIAIKVIDIGEEKITIRNGQRKIISLSNFNGDLIIR
jgi:hypothetical protein